MIGAHLDHLGRTGDVIYPGADDNASGTAALLEIAKAIAASPVRPKRTLAFAFWTGEEEGKFGSGHYVRHPVWPLERTTYLNLDMIGHPWLPEEIAKLVADTGLEQGGEALTAIDPADFIELGLPAGLPELDAALRRAAVGTGLALHFDRTDGTLRRQRLPRLRPRRRALHPLLRQLLPGLPRARRHRRVARLRAGAASRPARPGDGLAARRPVGACGAEAPVRRGRLASGCA